MNRHASYARYARADRMSAIRSLRTEINGSMKTFYVTTPIYYANSLPHLGHLYTMIVADTIARHKRQQGIETFFLTGTDEHGINIERAAKLNNRTPQEQADYVVSYFKKMTAAFGLDTAHGGYDIFMRTTEPFHYEGVRELWRRAARAKTPKGREAIYRGHYEGWFCAPCAAYKTEDEYVKPAVPDDPPTCLIHETRLDRVSEESYFFRLSDYDEALLGLYDARPDFVQPQAADDRANAEDQNRECEVELNGSFRPVLSAHQRLFENAPAINGSETDLHANRCGSNSPTVWKAFRIHRRLLQARIWAHSVANSPAQDRAAGNQFSARGPGARRLHKPRSAGREENRRASCPPRARAALQGSSTLRRKPQQESPPPPPFE